MNAYYGDRTPASPSDAEPAGPVTGPLAPKESRSGVYVFDAAQRAAAEAARAAFAPRLAAAGYGPITTELVDAPAFYYAEDYHQQYLHKNPRGYCGLGGTGVACPIGTGA